MCHGASVWSESKESNGDDAPHGGRAPQINTMSINEKIIRTKVGLLNLAEELGNVSKACQMMGLSRIPSIAIKMRWKQAAWRPYWTRIVVFPIRKIA